MNRVHACEAHGCGRSLVSLPHVRTKNPVPIEFAPSDRGNIIPVDDDGDPAPIVTAVAYRIRKKGEPWDVAKDGPLYLNHFATCAEAGRFHRRGAA